MKKIIALILLSVSIYAQDKVTVYFDFNRDIVNGDSAVLLKKWIAENPKAEVVKISGYCDSFGDSSYYQKLAHRRIQYVIKKLKENNITISNDVVLDDKQKLSEQSRIQSENRKVIIYFGSSLTTNLKTANKGDLIKLKNLYFSNNSDKVVSKSELVLAELLDVMNGNPKLKIEIQGHICCRRPTDSDPYSTSRAKAVYDYLLQNKIDSTRMAYKGYGVSRPIHPIPEKNAQEEDENRRVEIMIVEN